MSIVSNKKTIQNTSFKRAFLCISVLCMGRTWEKCYNDVSLLIFVNSCCSGNVFCLRKNRHSSDHFARGDLRHGTSKNDNQPTGRIAAKIINKGWHNINIFKFYDLFLIVITGY